MGPGQDRFRRTGRFRLATRTKSSKPGEVPIYDDYVDPRVYRRLLVDWIKFQDLADHDSSRMLTLGQQVFAIVANIRGGVGQRLGHISAMVHAGMTREEFSEMVDHILNIIDPLDKETAFLDTAKAWKELMLTSHGKRQTFEDYWNEYSALCIQYAYSHGEAARSPGVQELLGLLCVLNANLDRTEFNWVLQNAMGYQKEVLNRDDPSTLGQLARTLREGPQSAVEAMSQVRQGHRGTGPRALTVQSSGAASSSEAPHEIASPDVRDLAAAIQLNHGDIKRRNSAARVALEAAITAFEALPAEQQSAEVRQHIDQARTSTIANESSLGRCEALAIRVESVSTAEGPRSVETTQTDRAPPIITMESVRISLRRLDHGESAANTRVQRSTLQTRRSPENKQNTGRSLKSKTTTIPTSVTCWVCEGNHYANQVEDCKKKLEARRKMESGAKKAARVERPGKNQRGKPPSDTEFGVRSDDDEKTIRSKTLSWADVMDTLYTSKTIHTSVVKAFPSHSCEIIVDGGATGTVVGEANYVALCNDLGVKPRFQERRSGDPKDHAFGTKDNASTPQKIIGRCVFPLPVGNGEWLPIAAMVVDGDVPFILGKDTLQEFDVVEAHGREWIEFNTGGKLVRFNTPVNSTDGHARLLLSGNQVSYTVAESAISVLVDNASKRDALAMIRKVHARTHLNRRSMELLFKRSGKWKPWMAAEIARIVKVCDVCIRVGDPEPSQKFSLSKIDMNFNNRAYFDIMYWSGKPILHIADSATGYSEVSIFSTRELPHVLQRFDNEWIFRHGSPQELIGDQEFDKVDVHSWCAKRGITFFPLPARRHNKAGIIERKNRVVKDTLEKLDADPVYKRKNLRDRLTAACYISNIMYGNRTASAFELVRGYTPSVDGTGQTFVPSDYREAYEAMRARRLLARILKARPTKRDPKEISVGEIVLALVPGGNRPRGQWKEYRVEAVRDDNSVVVGKGRMARTIAHEDIRKLPSNAIAASVVRAEHGITGTRKSESSHSVIEEELDATSSTGSESTGSDDDADYSVRPHVAADTRESPLPEDMPSPTPNVDEQDASTVRPIAAHVPQTSQEAHDASHLDPAQEHNIRRSTRIRKPRKRLLETAMILSRDRQASEQELLGTTFEKFRNLQFYAREAPWITRRMFIAAEQSEVEMNWYPNVHVLHEHELPSDANVIGSHFVYKLKVESGTDGIQTYALKARLCVHGNRDIEKDSLRTDAAVVSHEGFRLTYCVASQYGFILGKCDIRGAYTQSGVAVRRVFVQPPRCIGARGQYWLLKATLYGLVSAGRK